MRFIEKDSLLRREKHRGIEASWVPMPGVMATLANRIAPFMAGLA
jgi:hypothetical protein